MLPEIDKDALAAYVAAVVNTSDAGVTLFLRPGGEVVMQNGVLSPAHLALAKLIRPKT